MRNGAPMESIQTDQNRLFLILIGIGLDGMEPLAPQSTIIKSIQLQQTNKTKLFWFVFVVGLID